MTGNNKEIDDLLNTDKKTNHFGPVQPGKHIDKIADLTEDERMEVDIPQEGCLVEQDIEVSYTTISFRGPPTNKNDPLHNYRVTNIESFESCSKCVVTTQIKQGDEFVFPYLSGTWEFVGTHELYEQKMLFVPADEEAENASLYPDYQSMLRADFARKFGTSVEGEGIERLGEDVSLKTKIAHYLSKIF